MHDGLNEADQPPLPQNPGEQTLRFLVPSFRDHILRVRRGLVVMSVVAVPGVLISVCVGLFQSTMEYGAVAFSLGTLFSVLIGLGGAVVSWPSRVRWWVTTRRLIVGVGRDVRVIELDDISDIQVDGYLGLLRLMAGGQSVVFGPVNGLSELWGALLFARAWRAPDITLREHSQHGGDFLRWAGMGDGRAERRGIMVLLPDTVTWIPQDGGHSTSFLYRRSAIPPLERFGFLMDRSVEHSMLETESDRVARSWGGWQVAPAAVSVRRESVSKTVTLHVEYGGERVRVRRLEPEFCDAILALWQVPSEVERGSSEDVSRSG